MYPGSTSAKWLAAAICHLHAKLRLLWFRSRESFGLLKIAGGIQIEEPAHGRQAKWMRDLAGLGKQLDGNTVYGLAETCRGGLEGGKATSASGIEFGLQRGQHCAVKHRRKGLVKAGECRNGNSPAGDSGAVEQETR